MTKNKQAIIFSIIVILVLIIFYIYLGNNVKEESLSHLETKTNEICNKSYYSEEQKKRCKEEVVDCEDLEYLDNYYGDIDRCFNGLSCLAGVNYELKRNKDYEIDRLGYSGKFNDLSKKAKSVNYFTKNVGKITTLEFIQYLDKIKYPLSYSALYFDNLSKISNEDESRLVTNLISGEYRKKGFVEITIDVSTYNKYLGGHMWIELGEGGILKGVDPSDLLERDNKKEQDAYYDFVRNHRKILGEPQVEIIDLSNNIYVNDEEKPRVVDFYLDKGMIFTGPSTLFLTIPTENLSDEELVGYFNMSRHCSYYFER